MNRIRNAVIIIVLCIIATMAYKARSKNELSLNTPAPEEIKDAVAGGPSQARHGLSMPTSGEDNLKDALAEGPAIPTGLHNGPRGNSDEQTPPPPRGGDHTGIGPLGGPNPGGQIPHNPPLSPSTPPSQPLD